MIEIKGVHFINKGAELMLNAIYQKLAHRYPSLNIALSPVNSPFDKRKELKSWLILAVQYKGIDWSFLDSVIPRFSRGLFGVVKRSEIKVVLDASGFAYGDQWSLRALKHTERHARQINSQGGVYIFMPQAFGPFNNSGEYKKLLNSISENSKYIFARDRQSLSFLRALIGEKPNLLIAPDFTNIYKPVKKMLTSADLLIIPNSKIVSSKNKSKVTKESYIESLSRLGNIAKDRNLSIGVLNHEGKSDRLLCHEVYKKISNLGIDCLFFDDIGADDIKQTISLSRFVVSSRFHGCVSALSQGIPSLATSWSHKYQMLYADYEMEEYVVEDSSRNLANSFENLILNEARIKTTLHEKCLILEEQSNVMWSKIYEEIGKVYGDS
ncbi:polysaccharide pyruvyl transferase family protein [Zooshikella ganghwensis]|uniref:Polysaccharide pyruvyl transferase family protein n=1 Tax=Zooshikella ganghwensis TaxID=202772 RepID=A0A4P9VKU9_9GAMM|nr:polysaccharide pyruvyl transferase family protein [Zooshikella ganghwensis]RDH43159.1 polysaccharide pyruvyl transferase family protein [Zooshikella ganghwensis]